MVAMTMVMMMFVLMVVVFMVVVMMFMLMVVIVIVVVVIMMVMLVIVVIVTGVPVFMLVVSVVICVFVFGVMMIVICVLVVAFKFDLFYARVGFYDFEIWIRFLKFRQPSLLKLDPDSKIQIAFFKRSHLFWLWFVCVRVGSFAHHHVYLYRVARDLLHKILLR